MKQRLEKRLILSNIRFMTSLPSSPVFAVLCQQFRPRSAIGGFLQNCSTIKRCDNGLSLSKWMMMVFTWRRSKGKIYSWEWVCLSGCRFDVERRIQSPAQPNIIIGTMKARSDQVTYFECYDDLWMGSLSAISVWGRRRFGQLVSAIKRVLHIILTEGIHLPETLPRDLIN